MGEWKPRSVGVIGLGYVGLPLAVGFAEAGMVVQGVEQNVEKVARVNAGDSYIDDVTPVRLQAVVKSGVLKASTEFSALKDCDAVIVCVPTPLTINKAPDVSYIENVSRALVLYLHKGELVVLESTTYPGTTDEVMLPILESSGLNAGADFYLAFSPERVDPGNAHYNTLNTPKVVGGLDAASTERACTLYALVVPQVYAVSSCRAAEMAKLLENTFRLVNVSLINELAVLCEKMDMDIWEVIEAAKTKPYGFMPFYPGPGIGGHCIPIDPFYLSWKAKEYDIDLEFVETAGKVNEAMPGYVVDKVAFALNSIGRAVRGARLLVLGVAYKKDISDLRESPALKVVEKLQRWGADVSFFDSHAAEARVAGVTLKSLPHLDAEVVRSADCVVILTDHSSVDYVMVEDNAQLIVDTRNAIKHKGPKLFRLGDGTDGR
ncbi:MAG: nucleotide sugar dehydrogenase [Candidatus Cryosericum sp.]